LQCDADTGMCVEPTQVAAVTVSDAGVAVETVDAGVSPESGLVDAGMRAEAGSGMGREGGM
jgi:hypothetical protein